MIPALPATARWGLLALPWDLQCPHCGRPLELSEADRATGVAVCPHAACQRRVVVEVLDRHLDGRPLLARVSTPGLFLARYQPVANHPRSRRVAVLASLAMATGTGGVMLFAVLRALMMRVAPPLEVMALTAITVLATVSWTSVALALLSEHLFRVFLWRRGVVMEGASVTLEQGGGPAGPR